MISRRNAARGILDLAEDTKKVLECVESEFTVSFADTKESIATLVEALDSTESQTVLCESKMIVVC